MTQVTRTVLKGYFNTGDTPIETQFANLIESSPNILDDDAIMHVVKAEVLYSNVTQTTIIALPANAVIWGIAVNVVTLFNDTGTDLLDIGITGTGNKYIDNLDVSSTFFESTSDNGATLTANNIPDSPEANIIFTYTGGNSDASAGLAYIFIHYTLH